MRPLYAGRALQVCLKCDHSHLSDLKWRKRKKNRRMTFGKFNLLAFSLLSRSNENAAVFSSRENFLKKRRLAMILWAHISISSKFFRSGFREKNALGT